MFITKPYIFFQIITKEHLVIVSNQYIDLVNTKQEYQCLTNNTFKIIIIHSMHKGASYVP